MKRRRLKRWLPLLLAFSMLATAFFHRRPSRNYGCGQWDDSGIRLLQAALLGGVCAGYIGRLQ
ncbi:hypothetical protein IDH41_12340 [Paenibacillus sp. IB182493]|uniref:Uncharacterized protein n=1 Tax=Paenibacillus arenilitoris TaxID=2772299 RepID=A0A927CJT2_9BACL|nr:hypothetical protein [Paenibacillus arenilitoris]